MKLAKIGRSVSVLAALLWMSSISSVVSAHKQVVVIPLGGDSSKPLKYVITVAKQNGDFDNLRDAVDSIDISGPSLPYLIAIGPGEFLESSAGGAIMVPEGVHITGSGQDTTIIRMSIGSDAFNSSAANIVLPRYSQISNLTLDVNSASNNVIGIWASERQFNAGRPAIVSNVHIEASGNQDPIDRNIGLYDDGGDISIIDTRFTVRKTVGTGTKLYGIYIINSDTRIDRVDIDAGATVAGEAYGVYQAFQTDDQVTRITNSRIRARTTGNGGNNTGILNNDFNNDIFVTNSMVEGYSASNNTPIFDDAVSGDMVISHSTLVGNINVSGIQKCFGVLDGGNSNTAELRQEDCFPVP